MPFENALKSLNKAVALLNAYEEKEMDIKELCEKANFVIESFSDLKERKEFLKENIVK